VYFTVHDVPDEPEVEIRLPGGRFEGWIRDEDGRPLEAVVYVDEHRFEAPDGRIVIHGVPAGPHVLVIGARDHLGEARRILLAADEVRGIDAVLPIRGR
jgi:hypothetical protein